MAAWVAAIQALACVPGSSDCTTDDECGPCASCQSGQCVNGSCPVAPSDAAAAGDASAPAADADAMDVESSDVPPADGSTAGDALAEPSDADVADAALEDASDGDSGTTDAAACLVPDAGPQGSACPPTGTTSCAYGDRPGYCSGGACVGCTDVADDSACDGAYGGGAYLCSNGACVPGECRSDSDCDGAPAGASRLCGLRRPSFCGACSEDAHCQRSSHYGPGSRCHLGSGSCIPNTCPSSGYSCSDSLGYCCASPAGNVCVPGRCCTDGDCGTGTTCIDGGCILTSVCPPAGSTLYVDPSLGSDPTGNGSTACPFRTITRALDFIHHEAASPTQVVLRQTIPATNAERRPIIVPENVRIVGDPVAADVLAVETAFILGAPSSGLSNLTIIGPGAIGDLATGVLVVAGSSVSTSIDHVTIRDFTGDGIVVHETGALTIGAGVRVVRCSRGLVVDGDGTAILDGPLVSDPDEQIALVENRTHGILVAGRGRIVIRGGTGFAGAVVAAENGAAGLRIEHAPSTTVAASTIEGLSTTGNGLPGLPWSGIDLRTGSRVVVRRSVSLANHGSGIRISSHRVSPIADDVDASGIDLGSQADPGDNIVQSTAAGEANEGAGLCLDLPPCAGVSLAAEGLVFGGGNDCGGVNPGPLSRGTACTGGVDLGVAIGSDVVTGCP